MHSNKVSYFWTMTSMASAEFGITIIDKNEDNVKAKFLICHQQSHKSSWTKDSWAFIEFFYN